MSRDDHSSLQSKAVNESIINHLFLPHYLPSSADVDFLIQHEHQNEHKILENLNELFKSLDTQTTLPIFSVLTKCIQRWSVLQNPKTLSVSNIQLTIQQLAPGDFLPLYFHKQNAAILIEIDENLTDQPLISSWQVLLPTKEITSSLTPHLSCFPVPTFRLCNRSQLISKPQCELLIDFMINTTEHSKSSKSSYSFDETRDIPESHYVCQWWITQFQGIEIENNVNTSIKFNKKHRDQIRWNTQLPFRRSGLWMTIKVVLHTILIKNLGHIGTLVYKLLITYFLTDVIYTRHIIISVDLLVHCLRKIARRLNKIDSLLSSIDSNDVNEWIQHTKQEIELKMKQILPKSDWQKTIQINEDENQKLLIKKFDLNQSDMYRHSCDKLKAYLNSHPSKKSYSNINNYNNSTLININQEDYIPFVKELINQLNYSVETALTRVEIWIESCLNQWINRPSSSKNRFEILLNFFEDYQSSALNHYYSTSNTSDSIGYSRFILTSLTLIYLMHQKLCQDERFQRLKLHCINIPNLLNLFEYLILPDRDDMIRARHLYEYFNQFQRKLYPDLLKDIESENAFGVYFADQSVTMNNTLQRIQAEAERDKQAKIEEVNQKKKIYQKLINEANNLQCKCQVYRYARTCDRCLLVGQANNIRASIYECPIPSRRQSALAVIFELQMPIEIRFYREIIWQFINRPNPQPAHNMYEWLDVESPAIKLKPFYTGPSNCKVKLVSSTKSITQSHYSAPQPIVSTSVDGFLFENSLKVEISPTKPTAFESECRILTPQLADSDYKDLQLAVDNTQFVQNRVIAKLSNCPLRLKPTQFVEFGSFRSGHYLQWWNLLSILEIESVSIDEESVAILIIHSLLQYGPLTADGSTLVLSWCPESHQQLLDDHFVDEFISRLNHRLDDCESNWQNELVLTVITVITMKILTICNKTRESIVTDLALKCRRVGEKWINLISESIQTISSSDFDKAGKLREKIVIIGITCLFTFSIHADRIHCIFSSNQHMISLLKAATTIHDNIILNGTQTKMNTFIRDMKRFSERVLVTIQPSVINFIEKTSYESLNEFAAIYWAVIRNKGAMDGKWKKRKLDCYDGWYDVQYETNTISINCITGTFLVNGMTIGFLSEKITSNPLFIRVFENYVFEVQAAELPNTYITKHPCHGYGRVQYEFHIDDQTNRLTITERHIGTDDRFQLIPHSCYESELPDTFVSNHSHWRNTKDQTVEFRSIRFQNTSFLDDKPYVLRIDTGHVTTTEIENKQILINRSSPFFQTLFKRYFSRLDDEPYVYMMKDDTIIHIHLSRLGIAFKYNTETNIITSREYSDMCIAENQWLGTLTGLKSGLLLSLSHVNNQELDLYQCRKLIVPFGQIHVGKAQCMNHQIVTIQPTSLSSTTASLHQYFVFILNDRLRILQSTDSPTGWLYLALLHAMTSHPLPDQYTGMTGMERAFQLLTSGGCWSDKPFDALSLNILGQIAAISPKVNYYPTHLTCMQKVQWNSNSLPHSMQHFGYYLIVKKLIADSQQFSFMHPLPVPKQSSKLNENNETLLGKLYWDYRDSYNPTARLTQEIEEEILCGSTKKRYQPISMTHPCDANYSPIHLVNDLYSYGDVNLKDYSEQQWLPLSQWLTNENYLKTVWVGLLKWAVCLNTAVASSNRSDEIERFEMFMDFLHYISAEHQIKPFYLQMLKTALKSTAISLESVIFPSFIQYQSIDEVSVRTERIRLPWSLTDDEKKTIFAEVQDCWEKNSTIESFSATEATIDKDQINKLLISWRLNRQLRLFLTTVQKHICSVPLVPMNTKVQVNPQQFALESIQDHHQIKLNSTDESIDQELICSAEKTFFHSNSRNFIKSTESTEGINQQKEFPGQIFPPINDEKNSLREIASYFRNQLYESWEKLQSDKQYKNKYLSSEKIKEILDSSRLESKQFWNQLMTSIRSSNELLFETGVEYRTIPTILISKFLQIWLIEQQKQDLNKSDFSFFLTKNQRTLLGGSIVNWIWEQQMERALHFANHNKQEDFEKELSTTPHSNWNPSEHVPWLILELEMNITIREIQVDVARHMIQPTMLTGDSTVKNIVMQMNMGEGKTSVIIPMLAVSLCSSSSSLVRVVVLKSLFIMNYESLRYKLGGLLNRRIFPFACRRDMDFSKAEMNQISCRLQKGLKHLDVILTSPEYILSFDLLTIDKCRRNEFEVSRWMLIVQRWLKTFVRDVLDESDEILHVKYQLIYTVGGQQQVDGGKERWETIQFVLELVKQQAEYIANNYNGDEVCYKSYESKSRFPQFRLLSHRPFSLLCRTIANNWLNQTNYRPDEQQLILSFILDPKSSIDCLNKQFPFNAIQQFLILRGLLSSEVLFITLKKRYRVNFGVNSNPKFNRLMAVPFRAKDVAADNTEFGHPDVAIVLTQLSYYYSGLNDFQLLQCFDRLSQIENDPAFIYEKWISYEGREFIFPSIQQWKGVNLKDYQQRTCDLFPTLRYNMLIINYFLNHFVFPREAKQFPHKLVASAWDLSSSSRTKIITGFSGTNDTQLLLPIHIRQYDLPKLQTTDAIVISNLLQSENENYQYLPINAASDDILNEIVNYESIVHVILDVGALFADGTNREIAVKWLKLSNKAKIDYAIYFESDVIVACDRQFRHHSFLTSPASERLDRCVIYLDEIHTRGTDFKFPTGFKAAVTLGNDLTKDRLVQGCMRMRKLGKGHSLTFWSSYEVHQQIRTLKKTPSKQMNTENIDESISLFDILRWVYENTQRATWDGLHHWAAQSLSFQTKVDAFQNIQWDNQTQTFTESMMRELAEGCKEEEIIELERLFGAQKVLSTLPEIYSVQCQKFNRSSSAEIHTAVLDRLHAFGGSKKRLAQLLDDEQQRELEQELEEERQVARPSPVRPSAPKLHDEIKALCDTHGDMLNLNQLTEVFRPLIYAFTNTTFFNDCQPNSWQQNLWVSTEFQRVIETQGESLNPFLRPPRWIVVYRNQHIIFVSAFEANWLMGCLSSLYRTQQFNNPSITTLRLLLPRTKRSQSILVNTPTLTVPPSLYRAMDFPIPIKWLVELFIFNGTIYFKDPGEQIAYCQCLGICPKPRTTNEERAFNIRWIDADGFVCQPEQSRHLHIYRSRFKSSPLKFVRQVIENRNNSHAPRTSHVGSIIFDSLKLL